ncbi:MAG: right-handed parallel beta-helix repeat-containing protein, partial [Promethearchaeota archaeon]
MRKKILFLTGLVLFFTIFIVPAFADCSYSGSGNWNITETDDCTNTSEIIWLNGNLMIYGNLTFDNVTLRVNGTTDGNYAIYVESGGLFNITGDTAYSNITNGDVAGANYIFYVKSGSVFEAYDSYISKAGWQNVNYHRGIDIYTNNTIMENNVISSDYRAIYLLDSTNNIFTNNNISSTHFAIQLDSSSNNNTFSGNNVSTPQLGVYLNDMPVNNTFTNNTIYSSGFEGIRFYYSESNRFTNNTISSASGGDAIYSYEGNYNNFTNNTIYSTGDRGVYLEWSTNNTFINNTIYSLAAGDWALYLDYAWNNTFINNNISATNQPFYFFETYDSIVENNTISATNSHGIELYYNVINNTFTNNNVSAYSYGIYFNVDVINNTFTNMNISSSNSVGIYSWNSNRNILINSTITGATSSNDFYLRGTGNITAINCSFNKSKTGFLSGATGVLYVKWYLDANVTDSESNPIQ